MRGFESALPSRGNRARLEELVDVLEWPSDYISVRMIGPLFSYAYVWFTIRTPNKPRQPIPKLCLDHDGDSDKLVTDICPYRKSDFGRLAKVYVINVIVRDLQVDSRGRELEFPTPRGEKESILGYRAFWAEKGDTRKTPVRLLIIREQEATKIQKLMKLNTGKDEDGRSKSFELSDSKYGCDINIMVDKSKKGPPKFDVQKGDRTPLTREERDYMLYRPNLLKADSLSEAKREMKDLLTKIVEDDDKDKRSRSRDDDETPRSNRRESEEVDDAVIDADIDGEDDKRPARRRDDDRSARRKPQDEEDDRDDVDLDADIDAEIDSEDDDEQPTHSRRDEDQSRRHSRDDEDEERPRRSRDDEDEERPRRSRDDEDKPARRRRL